MSASFMFTNLCIVKSAADSIRPLTEGSVLILLYIDLECNSPLHQHCNCCRLILKRVSGSIVPNNLTDLSQQHCRTAALTSKPIHKKTVTVSTYFGINQVEVSAILYHGRGLISAVNGVENIYTRYFILPAFCVSGQGLQQTLASLHLIWVCLGWRRATIKHKTPVFIETDNTLHISVITISPFFGYR